MGLGLGRTVMGSRPLRSRDPMTEKSSRAPPRTKLGRTFCFLLGRNGHDGESSPDPLLLAPDPISWHIAYKTQHNLGSYDIFSLRIPLIGPEPSQTYRGIGMKKTIQAVVFDAYGTLFDVSAAARSLESELDGKAAQLAELWRRKQLEYTWQRSLMGCFIDFRQVTADGLDYALATLGISDTPLRQRLLALYDRLEAYQEVAEVLDTLKQSGYQLAILSNGSVDMLASAVSNANISQFLDHVLSVDKLRINKPHPDVYKLATDALSVPAGQTMFLSSNCWDVHGASYFGLQTVWVNRLGASDEFLPGQANHMISDLYGLPGLLSQLAQS